MENNNYELEMMESMEAIDLNEAEPVVEEITKTGVNVGGVVGNIAIAAVTGYVLYKGGKWVYNKLKRKHEQKEYFNEDFNVERVVDVEHMKEVNDVEETETEK